MNFKEVKNLIFDLGGVVVNLDLDRTFSAFATASGKPVDELRTSIFNNVLWRDHETGKITDQELRNYFRTNYFPNHKDSQIDEIWNALLVDIPEERIALLKALRKKYSMFVLSNTNGIHIKYVNDMLRKTSGVDGLESLFDKVYYSHEIGYRKPDKESYNYVLQDQNILASETVFIDDNSDNIKAANALGIKTIHVESPQTIIELLKDA